MNRAIFATTLLVMLLLPTGCTTVNSLKPGVPRGMDDRGYIKTTEGFAIEVARRTYDEVWQASDSAISAMLDVVDRDKARGVIRAETGISWNSGGEYVGIFITPPAVEAPTYLVEVSSIRKSRIQITGPDLEDRLLRDIQHRLK